ncbi:subtilisin family serine protease [Mobilisporobacter senegalensis]|uniref:Subtilisin family serine protease n=1 Tax=Mobilisporobacter senegalensis TaxID=1329262 RepID=A0A3N1XXT7_9FIRM|nr:S8 family peptidase [Mobilisporobacter senegalensis]ROR31404.1 subtilisin family serine protease [Mobilisporobacter senegalensis]
MKKKTTKNLFILIAIIYLFNHISNISILPVNAEDFLDTGNDSITQVEEYESNEIIINYKDTIDHPDSNKTLASINDEGISELSDTSIIVELKNKSDLSEAIDILEADENIASIQPNYVYKTNAISEEPYYSLQWALENKGVFVDQFGTSSRIDLDMNVSDIPDDFTWNREVIVAVIDTGIANTHEDLKDSMWINPMEIAGDGIDNDSNGFVDDIYGWNFYSDSNVVYNRRTLDDHGTHVAGIVAASQNKYGIAGVASFANVKIMTLQALGGSEGSGSTESIIKGIQYAEKMGASICNISAGTYNNDIALQNSIKKSKMLFVVAAGNGDDDNKGLNNDTTPIYPASFNLDNIISVANLTCNGTLHPSSNYGINSVDIAAPGTSIWSTLAGNRYGYLSGTSMAAPMVTGVAALIYSHYDKITLTQVKAIILNSVKEVDGLNNKISSGGIPDAFAALNYTDEDLLNFDLTPPTIITSEKYLTNSYYKSLNITIKDNSNSLSSVRFAKGSRAKSYFNSLGTKLTLKNNIGTINVTDTSTYTIYAKDKAGNETIKVVKVTIVKPTKITTISKKTMKIGSIYHLKPTLYPANVRTGLTFRSTNKNVATIGLTQGKITARSKGTTTITVTTQNGLTAKFKLTVTK